MATVASSSWAVRLGCLISWAALIAVLYAPSTARASESWRFEGLKPGRFVVHKQFVAVRIVLIGFDEGQVDEAALRSWLPRNY